MALPAKLNAAANKARVSLFNGLGMLRQFRLNPDNPEQLEEQLEQFREMPSSCRNSCPAS